MLSYFSSDFISLLSVLENGLTGRPADLFPVQTLWSTLQSSSFLVHPGCSADRGPRSRRRGTAGGCSRCWWRTRAGPPGTPSAGCPGSRCVRSNLRLGVGVRVGYIGGSKATIGRQRINSQNNRTSLKAGKQNYRCVPQQSTGEPDTHRLGCSVQPPWIQTPLLGPESGPLPECPVPAHSELDQSPSCNWTPVGLAGRRRPARAWRWGRSKGLRGGGGCRTPLWLRVVHWMKGTERGGRPEMEFGTEPVPDTGSGSESWDTDEDQVCCQMLDCWVDRPVCSWSSKRSSETKSPFKGIRRTSLHWPGRWLVVGAGAAAGLEVTRAGLRQAMVQSLREGGARAVLGHGTERR